VLILLENAFKAAVMTMIQKALSNMLKTSEKMFSLSRNTKDMGQNQMTT
jgi:hypothetical protein